MIRVPCPGGLSISASPSAALTRFDHVGQPAARRIRAAGPVVGDLHLQLRRGHLHGHAGLAGPRVLDRVGERLARGEVGGGLGRGRHPVRRDVQVDGQREPFRDLFQRRRQAALHERGGVDAVGQVAQFGEDQAQLVAGTGEGGGGAGVFRLRHRRGQPGGQAEQALLRPVMQVAFEPAPFGQRGGHDPGARRTHVVQFGAGGFGLQLCVPQGQPAGAHRGVEQPPVPLERGVGDDHGDRGAGVGTDHLDETAVGPGGGQRGGQRGTRHRRTGRGGTGYVENFQRRIVQGLAQRVTDPAQVRARRHPRAQPREVPRQQGALDHRDQERQRQQDVHQALGDEGVRRADRDAGELLRDRGRRHGEHRGQAGGDDRAR